MATEPGQHPDLLLRERAEPGAVPRFVLDEWRSRFGVVAGITGRGDGAGRGFDLGLWTEAPVRDVMQRWTAFRSEEPGFHGVVLGMQVHGDRVLWHEQAAGWSQVDGVDGHATAAPGVLLTVTVADCVPVYLHCPRTRAVALLHAGWRGTAAGILEAGVALLEARSGASRAEMAMHCGVGICGDCYEVGPEVLEAVGLRGDGRGPWLLDLRERLQAQGEALGLGEVSRSDWCSAHHRPLFYSHRKSGGSDGRMVAYIGMPAVPSAVDEAPAPA